MEWFRKYKSFYTHTHDDKEIIGRLSYKYGKILFNLIKIVIINLFYLFIRWKLLDYYINLLVNISHTSYVFFFLKYIICMFNSCVVNLYYISLIIFTLKVLRLKTFLITVFLRNCEFAFLRSCVRTTLDMFRLVEFPPPLPPFLPNLTYRNRCAGCHFVLETRDN